MAIYIREAFGSRASSVSKDESKTPTLWHVFGSDDDAEMIDYLIASLAGGLVGHSSVPLTKDAIELEQLGPLHWFARVNYSSKRRAIGTSVLNFDTSGGSTHITQSLSTLRSTAGAPNFDGAINVSEDRVDGVDITIPSFKFSETHIVAAADVDLAYLKTLSELTGATNNATFKGWAAGEVLFLGASGVLQLGDDAAWEITYSFDMSPNRIIPVGSLGNILKEGWAYLWIVYRDTEDGNSIVKQPKAAYVEQVYPEADFADIEIGT